MPMFIAVSITIAKRQKQPKCPSPDKHIRKSWCVGVCVWNIILPYKRKFYHVTTRMNLEDIMLSKISLHAHVCIHTHNYLCFHLYEVSEVVKCLETENRILVARSRDNREKGSCCYCSRATEFQHLQNKNILEICCTISWR